MCMVCVFRLRCSVIIVREGLSLLDCCVYSSESVVYSLIFRFRWLMLKIFESSSVLLPAGYVALLWMTGVRDSTQSTHMAPVAPVV